MIKKLRYILLAALLTAGCKKGNTPPPNGLIALSPAITETLFDMGLGDRLVGVARHSDAIRELNLPIVGDFNTLNYEALYTLKPQLVILENATDEQKQRLHDLKLNFLETKSLTLHDITDSIQKIGKACNAEAEAEKLLAQFKENIDQQRNSTAHRPRTLITFSDFGNGGEVKQVYAFGPDCIHSELLEIAGGENVVTDPRPFVTLSLEAVIHLNPEIIIELTDGRTPNQWDKLDRVDAVRLHKIFPLTGSYTTLPAPNCLMQILRDFSEIIRKKDAQ